MHRAASPPSERNSQNQPPTRPQLLHKATYRLIASGVPVFESQYGIFPVPTGTLPGTNVIELTPDGEDEHAERYGATLRQVGLTRVRIERRGNAHVLAEFHGHPSSIRAP